MDGINRKLKQDITPKHQVVKPQSVYEEISAVKIEKETIVVTRTEPSYRSDSSDKHNPQNIDENPFFTKGRIAHRPFVVPNKTSSHSHIWLWFLSVCAILIAMFTIMSVFSSATLEILPQSESALIDSTLTASKDATTTTGLVFNFLSLTDERSKQVPATIDQNVPKQAFGTVIIYNAYSSENQRLIKNTRLESADHKIFRINDSVVVPGAKVSGGKITTPGSVEAVIYADAVGKDYNIGLADFTIPGFKGDPRYTKFSAKSKPNSPIAGGFSGSIKVPSDEVVALARTALRDELRTTAVEKARAEIPAGMTFFPGSLILKYAEPTQESKGDSATISMSATVSVFFFDTALLTQKIAEIGLKDYKDEPVIISNMQSLVFTFLDPVDNVVLSDLLNVKFSLKGTTAFVWNVDTEKLRSELAGKNKKDFEKVISSLAHIKKASMNISPFWSNVVPSNTKKITVKILDK